METFDKTELINYTPHPINIYRATDVYFAPTCAKLILKAHNPDPVKIIPPSGQVLNAQIAWIPEKWVGGVPTWRYTVQHVDPLPEGQKVIVSRFYARALGGFLPPRVYIICQPVYRKRESHPCGCLGLELVK